MLLFGLPVDFTSILLQVAEGEESEVNKILSQVTAMVQDGDQNDMFSPPEGEEEEDDV